MQTLGRIYLSNYIFPRAISVHLVYICIFQYCSLPCNGCVTCRIKLHKKKYINTHPNACVLPRYHVSTKSRNIFILELLPVSINVRLRYIRFLLIYAHMQGLRTFIRHDVRDRMPVSCFAIWTRARQTETAHCRITRGKNKS